MPKGINYIWGLKSLDKDGVRVAFADKQVYFSIPKSKRKKGLSWVMAIGGLAVGVGAASLSTSSSSSLPLVLAGTVGTAL